MRIPPEFSALVLVVLSFSWGAPPVELQSPPSAQHEEISQQDLAAARAALTRFSAKLKDARFLSADYVQTRETFLFGKPIVSKGQIRLRREPPCLRMDVHEPKRAIIRSDATSHLTWYEGKDRAERFVFDRNEMAITFVRLLTGEVKMLEQSFEIVAFIRTDKLSRISLVPLDKKLEKHIMRLDLSIGTVDSLPRVFTHENAQGESVRIELIRPKLNRTLEDGESTFDNPLPPAVRVVSRRI